MAIYLDVTSTVRATLTYSQGTEGSFEVQGDDVLEALKNLIEGLVRDGLIKNSKEIRGIRASLEEIV